MRKHKLQMAVSCSILMAVLLAGCGQPVTGLSVNEGWVRALPPGKTVTAGFAELHNPTASDCAIVAISSPQAERVELHSSAMDEGVMRMRPMESPTIAAGSSLLLAPGGNHFMLFGLGEHAAHLERVELLLSTSCGDISAELPVRRSAAGGDHSHH